MDMSAHDEDALAVVQLYPDHLAAEVVANLLRVESVPALVRNLSAIPGLEQGAQVLVPASVLHRARRIMAHAAPSEAELTLLATGEQPAAEDGECSGPR